MFNHSCLNNAATFLENNDNTYNPYIMYVFSTQDIEKNSEICNYFNYLREAKINLFFKKDCKKNMK